MLDVLSELVKLRYRLVGENPNLEIKSGIEFKHYLLQTKLGDGASGEVWKARDLEKPRNAAVKIMRDYLVQSQNPIHRERFVREIAAMQKLGEHPNIPSLYDWDDHSKPPYFVMQFIGGDGMDTILETGKIKEISALNRMDIISQISDALSFAHAEGYIHRDIKPGNIKIIGDDTAFLMDFSVTYEESVQETQLGIGTPLYMPPEVFPSRAGDIFSLALVCYEILYGIHAIFRPTDRITTAVEAKALMDTRLRDKTWNHPAHSPMLQNLTVDLDRVNTVFEKALAYKPEDRYQDAQAFSNDLRKAVGLQPINARPRTTQHGLDYDELSQATPIYISGVSSASNIPSAEKNGRPITLFGSLLNTTAKSTTLPTWVVGGLVGVVLILLAGAAFVLFSNTDSDNGNEAAFAVTATATASSTSEPTFTPTNLPPTTVVPTEVSPTSVSIGTATIRATRVANLATRTATDAPPATQIAVLLPTASATVTLEATSIPTIQPTPLPLNLKQNLESLFEIVSNPDEYQCPRFNEYYEHFKQQQNNAIYKDYSDRLIGTQSPMTFIHENFCKDQSADTIQLLPVLEDKNDELIQLLQNIFQQLP